MSPVASAPIPPALAEALAGDLEDARRRTLEVAGDFARERLLGPRLPIVNPPLWELGHVAWFQEKWCLRHGAGRAPIRRDADALYDSAAVAHDLRWDLPLPTVEATRAYLEDVLDRVRERLRTGAPTEADAYHARLATFHEDMHAEAFAYTRQTLADPEPSWSPRPRACPGARVDGDVEVPGGTFLLGATRGADPFVFDNEKWSHAVVVAPFRIARTPVTEEDYARFVDDGGYRRRACWSETGWAWRESVRAEHPVHWRRGPRGWERRRFHRWTPLEARHPVLHVSWHEAEAWCRWAGRRLPTEAEWEAAALGEPDVTGRRLAPSKRRWPWGESPPTDEHANLDAAAGGPVAVDDHPAGDSAFGVRQVVGNAWEWTADDFRPYPGFVVDPYAEYSAPWFGTHKVLRGGAWVTRARLLRGTWRNFFTPDRRDVYAGFRTCAGDA